MQIVALDGGCTIRRSNSLAGPFALASMFLALSNVCQTTMEQGSRSGTESSDAVFSEHTGRCGCGLRIAKRFTKQFTNFRMPKPATSTAQGSSYRRFSFERYQSVLIHLLKRRPFLLWRSLPCTRCTWQDTSLSIKKGGGVSCSRTSR